MTRTPDKKGSSIPSRKSTSYPMEGRSTQTVNACVISGIAAAISLLAVAALNAAPSVASTVTAAATPALALFVCDTPFSSTVRTDDVSGSAAGATPRWSAASAFGRSGGSCWHPLYGARNDMTSPDRLPPLTDEIIYGMTNGLFEDDLGRALLDIWHAGVIDERTYGMIRHRVDKDRLGQALSGMPFREPRLGEGAFVIGLDLSGRVPLRMPIQYLNAHTLTIANTGAGKTIRGKFYALQIAPYVRGLWLLDLRKREFRVLRPYLSRVGVDLVVLDARALRINPLQVPLGVTPVDWTSRVSDMLIQVLGLPPRASKLVQTVLFRLYRKFGVFDGAERYPTLFDLHEAVRADEDANPPARLAVLDSLEPVLRSLGPQVLAYRFGWTSTDLAARHLAIEFGGIGEVEKNLLLNSLVLSEFASRVARGVSNPKMDLWICCDEAQRLCSAGSGQTGAITDLVGMVRGTGIGLDLSVPSTADLASQVLSNTATKIMGRCGSAADYAAAGHSMGLTSDQIQWAQLNLNPGLFVGQLGEGDWRRPFVFRIPPMRLPEAGQDDGSSDGRRLALPVEAS